jgi:hypothetical protein
MSDFKALLKKSSNIEKFSAAIDKESKGSFQKDEGYWQPEVDAAGNGFAVIRFLPTPPIDGEDGLPWVKYFEHGFKGPTGQWYIELSLTTLGLEDPVSQYNTKLWETGVKSNKDIASLQKRKLRYVSNIEVVSDPKHPENDGMLFKYRFGAKIFDKIKGAMKPEIIEGDDEQAQPVDVFDFFTGANFKLRIRNVEKQRNYDKSEFSAPTPHRGGDEAVLEEIWNNLPSLKEVIEPSKFKDYATLKQRLDRVLGFDTGLANPSGSPATNQTQNDEKIESRGGPALNSSSAESVVLGSDDDPNIFENLATES